MKARNFDEIGIGDLIVPEKPLELGYELDG